MPTRFFVEQRTDYQGGKSFGSAGPYEFIEARAVTDSGEGRLAVLKPRDPVKGNGTFIFALNPSGKPVHTEDLLNQGYTFVNLTWKDKDTAPKGAQDVLNFLRITGGPMLLGDQRRFVKRLLVVEANSWLPAFKEQGLNTGLKGSTLIDGTWPEDAQK